MTEGLINLVDDDSSRDVQGTVGTPGEDHMETSRFTAQVPRPGSTRQPSVPQALVVPPPRSSSPTGAIPQGGLYPSEPPAALPRTSWWRSLIASTLAPTAPEGEASAQLTGRICLGFALFFSLTALFAGLRGAPLDASAPSVAVAVVVARVVLALGLLAFAHTLVRMGERFLRTGARRKRER
jgi:hypothetical protein